MTPDEETNQLTEKLLRYIDGNLEEQERLAIEERLKSDRGTRDLLRSLAEQAVVAADSGRVDQARNEVTKLSNSSSFEPGRKRQRAFFTRLGIAAALMLALFAWLSVKESRPSPGVARILQLNTEARANQTRSLSTGDELFPGDKLEMPRGLIELAFHDTGVHVTASAPLSMRLDNTSRLYLELGDIKLVVPPQGVGFVVDTAEQKITDLGTSFVVKANREGSELLVLDGKVAIGDHGSSKQKIMGEGARAKFRRNGTIELVYGPASPLPELSLSGSKVPAASSLHGMILGHQGEPINPRLRPRKDVIGKQVLPLIQSGFQDRACIKHLKQGSPVRFAGIAGSYAEFPERTGLTPFLLDYGWLAWYSGQVTPPQPGRYRFHGYADNHLLLAIDGKPVFEGSRHDSPFTDLGISRTDNPSLPCLVANAGLASGPWIDLTGDPVQLDILFGEIDNNQTSGLLLVEREGAVYENTYWGQPRWPLFLTEKPIATELTELNDLLGHMEAKLMGSFSVSEEAVWNVVVPE